MATSSTIRFNAVPHAAFSVSALEQASADKITEVLQDNHDNNDCISTDWGAHNHTVHHLTAIFSLGATPRELQERYDHDNSWQRRPPPEDTALTSSLADKDTFIKHMNTKTSVYSSYFRFFTDEIEKHGWPAICNEYLFKGDRRANIMLNRLFSSYLHPYIHLGIGIEFQQPAFIAQALGMTPIHPAREDPLFIDSVHWAIDHRPKRAPLMNIIDNIRADEELRTATPWKSGTSPLDTKVTDLLANAHDKIIAQAARWQITAEDDFDDAVAQLTNVSAYYTGAAQRRDKRISFDFFFMHMINSSIFLPAYLRQAWISKENKAKLLTWKGRNVIMTYASRRAPELLKDEIVNYKPRHPPGQWQDIFVRARVLGDDGHGAKLIRALAFGERECERFSGPNFPMEGAMWLQMANMVMDSVEVSNPRWVRSVGFDEAWENVPSRDAV